MNSTIVKVPAIIRDVDSGTFEALVLRGTGPVVVEFMSYACAHCRVLEPVLEHVARTLRADESFFRVNVAIDPDLANVYAIGGTPTLVFFRDGEELGRVEGPHPAAAAILSAVVRPFK